MTIARDNGSVATKVKIRRWAMEQLGGEKKVKVLELFGGVGLMYERCYTECAQHLAFDVRDIKRPGWLMGDNRTLLPSYVNDGWNLYDADAYANPWIIGNDVARLRKPGTYVFVATDSIRKSLRTSTAGKYVRQLAGLTGIRDLRLVTRWYDDLVRWFIADWRRHGVTVDECKRLVQPGLPADTYYYAMIATKK